MMVTHRRRAHRMPLLGAALLLAGCAVGASSTYSAGAPPVRAATDAPDRFVAVAPNSDSTSSTVGDYSVPRGRYGVQEGELLRLQCPSGKPLGVVPASAR